MNAAVRIADGSAQEPDAQLRRGPRLDDEVAAILDPPGLSVPLADLFAAGHSPI